MIFVYFAHNNGNQTTESLGKMIPPLSLIKANIYFVLDFIKSNRNLFESHL